MDKTQEELTQLIRKILKEEIARLNIEGIVADTLEAKIPEIAKAIQGPTKTKIAPMPPPRRKKP